VLGRPGSRNRDPERPIFQQIIFNKLEVDFDRALEDARGIGC